MSLFLLSAATLLFEIDLSRLFSVAQFYHFAFMVVSLALLGFGASGTALSLFPTLLQKSSRQSLAWLSLACGFSMLGAYLLTNTLPFDSFSIAWDRRQAFILALHYLALTLPFFFGGLAVGLLLAMSPQAAGRTYAINLVGSACGCLLALFAPTLVGAEGIVTLSSGLAFLAAINAIFRRAGEPNLGMFAHRKIALLFSVFGLCFVLIDTGLRINGQGGLSFLELQLSPYKSLSYILQQPGARVDSRQWNAYSRVDVVSSPGIHSFPGLSYRYLQPLPAQKGLLVDGDDLSPIVVPGTSLKFTDFMPSAIAFHLHPQARTLVLGGRGGLDVFTALALSAGRIDAVEVNPIIISAAPVYNNPQVRPVASDERSYLRSASERYDVIVLSLASAYHPVRSGAYSLAEDYRYTVESFEDALSKLDDEGILSITRWLQDPPSEDLRTFALAVTSLQGMGLDPRERIVALRGYNTATFLIKVRPFRAQELAIIRRFAGERAYDLSYAPGIRSEETNRYNILAQPVYYQAYQALLDANPQQSFYQQYPFEVTPPTDDHPFFGHFFKWSQSGQVLAELGKTWQPFGGAGYFVILALLLLSMTLASVLILLPVVLARSRRPAASNNHVRRGKGRLVILLYFSLIGFAYLFVEIPLIQKFILFLGHPTYAMTAILFALLLFSGIGSYLGKKISQRYSLVLLVVLLIGMPVLLPEIFSLALGQPFIIRLLLTVLLLAPVGFLMGIPFPGGIRQLEADGRTAFIPWSWAVNGSASVVSAVLAALLALTFGFNWVLRLGALCYAAAWLTMQMPSSRHGMDLAPCLAPSPVNGTNETPPRS
jgi:hypothetical protein